MKVHIVMPILGNIEFDMIVPSNSTDGEIKSLALYEAKRRSLKALDWDIDEASDWLIQTEGEHLEETKDKDKPSEIIVASGKANGYFRYGDVERVFTDDIIAIVHSKGGIIVMQGPARNDQMKPICYIESGADIALARNLADAELEISAIADDGREILVTYEKLSTITGLNKVIGSETTKELDTLIDDSILRAVANAPSMYGRHTISRILVGSASKKVLTLKLSTLTLYGVLADVPFMDVLDSVDSLVEQGLLTVKENNEFRVLDITEDGKERIETKE